MPPKVKSKMRPISQLRRTARRIRNLKAISNLKTYNKAEKDWLHSEVKRQDAVRIRKENIQKLRKQ